LPMPPFRRYRQFSSIAACFSLLLIRTPLPP
jgi:hypothetical protein